MGGFPFQTNAPNLILENYTQKAPIFVPNWVFFAAIWYSDRSQNHTFRGKEMVQNSEVYFEHPRTKNENPPGI